MADADLTAALAALAAAPAAVVVDRVVRDARGALDDLVIVLANDEAAALFGLPREMLEGRAVREVTSPVEGAASFAVTREVLATGQPQQGTWPLRRPDGSEVSLGYVQTALGDDHVVTWFRDTLAGLDLAASSRRAYEELEASERLYRLLAQNTTDLVVVSGTAGPIVWASPSARTLLGRDPADLVGSYGPELVVEPDRPRALEMRAQVDAGTPATAEVRLRRADGGTFWAMLTSRPLEERGVVVGRVTTARDISDLVRDRQRAEAAEETLARAFEVSPDGFALLREVDEADGGGIVLEQVNAVGRATLMRVLGDEPGWWHLPAEHPLADALTWLGAQAPGAAGPRLLEQSLRGPDGVEVRVELGVADLVDGRRVMTVRDVTEAAALRAELAESLSAASAARALLYTTLDSSPYAFQIYRVDRTTEGAPMGFTIEFANKPSVPADRDVRDYVGADLVEMYPASVDVGIYAALLEAADAPEPVQVTLQAPDLDTHEARWYDVVLTRIDDDLVVSLRIDVTDRVETAGALEAAVEVAQAASRAKSDFLATITHEIRTPLATMLAVTDLLVGTSLDVDQRELVARQRTAATLLLAIVNDILDLSKIEAGAIELEAAEVRIDAVIRRTLSMVEDAAATKGLAVEVVLGPDVPDVVVADEVRLKQILLNLLSNAVKFTTTGSVRIEIEAEPRPEGPASGIDRDDEAPERLWLRLQVTDTGVGLTREQSDRLFQPFSQAESSITRRYGGTGLGLSIVRGLVEAMGGRLGVVSEPGAGSTFWCVVPVGRVPATSAAPESTTTAAEALHGTVLLVEDNDVNRHLVARMLTSMGLDVETVADGAGAVERASRGGLDLVLMDVSMPVMDGLEATRRLREAEVGARRTPVVALTANATREAETAAREAGMDAFVTKPVRLAALREVVASWLARG